MHASHKLLMTVLISVVLYRDSIQDVGNILGSLYLSMLFLGIINSRTVQPVAANERAVSAHIPIHPSQYPLPLWLLVFVGLHNCVFSRCMLR